MPKPPIELRSDGWKRFEQAVDVAMKTPAKHRAAKPAKKRAQAKRPKARS